MSLRRHVVMEKARAWGLAMRGAARTADRRRKGVSLLAIVKGCGRVNGLVVVDGEGFGRRGFR